jgi:hypothetical protein
MIRLVLLRMTAHKVQAKKGLKTGSVPSKSGPESGDRPRFLRPNYAGSVPAFWGIGKSLEYSPMKLFLKESI